MRTTTLPGPAADFARVSHLLRDARTRPEVRVTEVPAPTRIAPHALAMTAEVLDGDGDELATGRFVLLHDPSCPEPWDGAWRAVTFARADMESELATDPVLGEAGWSWLRDAIHERGLHWGAEAGTVTRVVSEGFGGLTEQEASVDMEIRASWTPDPDELTEHFLAWTDVLCAIAGLPPLPPGVVALPGQRR